MAGQFFSPAGRLNLHLLTVPYDSALRSFRMGAGPEYLLSAGLAESLESAGHSVQVETIDALDDAHPAEIRTAFELNRVLAQRVRATAGSGAVPIVLAGNCVTALGTLAGLTPGRCAVLWFDAHGDFNTPDTTRGGFLDGMALATLTGRCWQRLAATVEGHRPVPEKLVVLLGTRDLDILEERLLRESEVTVLPPAAVRSELHVVLKELGERADSVYVHLDLDVLDPSEGRSNAFAAPDGLRVAELRAALEHIRAAFRIRALAVTAYDPSHDPDDRVARTAIELIQLAFSEAGAAPVASFIGH